MKGGGVSKAEIDNYFNFINKENPGPRDLKEIREAEAVFKANNYTFNKNEVKSPSGDTYKKGVGSIVSNVKNAVLNVVAPTTKAAAPTTKAAAPTTKAAAPTTKAAPNNSAAQILAAKRKEADDKVSSTTNIFEQVKKNREAVWKKIQELTTKNGKPIPYDKAKYDTLMNEYKSLQRAADEADLNKTNAINQRNKVGFADYGGYKESFASEHMDSGAAALRNIAINPRVVQETFRM